MEEYRRWEDNIKMDLKEIGVNVRSWIDLAQYRNHEFGIEPRASPHPNRWVGGGALYCMRVNS